jgi:hypothetical protein
MILAGMGTIFITLTMPERDDARTRRCPNATMPGSQASRASIST